MAAIDILNNFETQTLPAIDKTFQQLSPEKLSLTDYTASYEALRKSINDITKSFNDFYAQNPTIPDSLATKWSELLARKEALKSQFKNLPKPDTLTTLKGVNIGKVSPRSGFRDVPLSTQEILSMKIGKFLASSDECEYYAIDLNKSYKIGSGIEKKVLRMNTKNDSFELALVDITSDLNDAGDIQRFIVMNEEARNFQDIEIDGSASISNPETLGGAAAGVAAGAVSMGTYAGVAGATIGPVGAALGALSGAVAGGTSAAMIDRDYTSADAKNDGLYARMQQVKTYAIK